MNDMSISQASTVLNAIESQMTGSAALTAITNAADFVAAAQTLLKTGYDPVINAISQVWSRSIFSVRDYKAPLSNLEMTLERFGNAIRKLSPVAREMVDDDRFTYPVAYDGAQLDPYGNGLSVDMYALAKQDVLQTNFYGTAVYEQDFSIFRDQFDVAMSGVDEFMRFNSMMVTERNNEKEQYKEAIARGIQANFIGGLIDEAATDRVIHLITEYNAASGSSLDSQTVFAPSNFTPFIRWTWARIKTIIRLMGERSQAFQTTITGKPVYRHSRPEDLRVAVLANYYDEIETMAMSETYHDDYLKGVAFEGVSFWQSIGAPDSVKITPVYTDNTGAIATASAVSQDGVFALIHDRDALGYGMTNSWSAVTPFNTKGAYWNEHYHAAFKTIQDNTEKGVVFLLD